MVRKNLAGTLALTIGALLTVAGFGLAPRAVAAPAALTDPVGDTIDRNTNDKLASPRTDIVGASVDSGAQGIVLAFKTQDLVAPAADPNWASLNTFVSWQVDSSGDGKVDDLIRYSLDRDNPGGLIGEVTHWSGPGQPAKHCDAQATFDPAAGYSLVIAPACMNNPAAISYRVQLTYDTDPKKSENKDPNAPKPTLAFDVLPDTGLAGPVPIAVPTAPAAAPPAPGSAPAPPAGENPAPGQAAPPATTGATSPSKPAGGTAAKPTPKPTAPARTPASTAAPNPAAPAPAAAPTEPSGELAATGPSMARWLGALGGALMLLGGLGLMTPADRRRRSTV